MGATDDFLKKLRSNEMFYNTAGGKRPEMRIPTKTPTKFKRITSPVGAATKVAGPVGTVTSTNPAFGKGVTTFNQGSTGTGINWKGLGAKANTLIPYASNIINGLRKPPAVPNPSLDSEVTLAKVNYDADRAYVSNNLRGVTRGAFRTLDENTANAVGLAARGNAVGQMNSVNQGEQNQNAGIRNQQEGMNAQIRASNNQKLDQTNQMRVERSIAQQREQSANISNAADKYTAIQNEKAKADLDFKKFGVVAAMYNKDGVAGRTFKGLGNDDPLGLEYQNNGLTEKQNTVSDYLAEEAKKRNKKTKDYTTWKGKYGGSMSQSAGARFKKLN